MVFGPLNQAGGDGRLNVAITRAREKLIVFGSILSEHIDLSRTSALGVRHLKEFLDYVRNGARAFARAATGPLGDHESTPFEVAVAQRLSTKGWTLHPQIGVSGFRIDLAVVDPDASGAFLAGIECDGATYHRGATAGIATDFGSWSWSAWVGKSFGSGLPTGGPIQYESASGCTKP